jgi:hypothetical protein
MKSRIIFMLLLIYCCSFLAPSKSHADGAILYAKVIQLNGTIMIHRPTSMGTTIIPVETGTKVFRKDTLYVYDKSWMILKSPIGDLIGFDGKNGETIASFDELYKVGPDREIRILLKQGELLIRAQNDSSLQSFFEIHAGTVVSEIKQGNFVFKYHRQKSILKVQMLQGHILCVDPQAESQLIDYSQRIWIHGKLTKPNPLPISSKTINYFQNIFFNGKATE